MAKLKKRILVVDDSSTIAQWSKMVLEAAGYEVESRGDIWIADAVREFRPDMLLIDVNLGGMARGSTAVRALRARKGILGEAKMILYSSAQHLADICEDCGADGFIPKTASPEALAGRVAFYMDA